MKATEIGSPDITDSRATTASASRRTVLKGAGATGAAVVAGAALAACGSKTPAAPPGTNTPTGGATAGNTGPAAANGPIAKTSDIPVGGGKIFVAQETVVTQPTAGKFKAFTAICTHMGCTVGTVANGLIICPCHGSEYSIVDGTVKGGPAPLPLMAKQVSISGGEITVTD